MKEINYDNGSQSDVFAVQCLQQFTKYNKQQLEKPCITCHMLPCDFMGEIVHFLL